MQKQGNDFHTLQEFLSWLSQPRRRVIRGTADSHKVTSANVETKEAGNHVA